jgi:hypothetical protein
MQHQQIRHCTFWLKLPVNLQEIHQIPRHRRSRRHSGAEVVCRDNGFQAYSVGLANFIITACLLPLESPYDHEYERMLYLCV